jgi:hypothetical protein
MSSFPVRAPGSKPAPDDASWSLEFGLMGTNELAVPLLQCLPPRKPWRRRGVVKTRSCLRRGMVRSLMLGCDRTPAYHPWLSACSWVFTDLPPRPGQTGRSGS